MSNQEIISRPDSTVSLSDGAQAAPATSPPVPAAAAERMNQLRLKYLSQMSERIGSILAIENKLVRGEISDADRAELIIHSHKLAGSGGLYGFKDITDFARTLEVTLKNQQDLPVAEVLALVTPVVQACRMAQASVGLSSPAPAPAALAPVAREAIASAAPMPTQMAQAQASSPQHTSGATDPIGTAPRRPLLHIVDDDEAITDILIDLFSGVADILTDTTPSGAFEQMSARQPDLILLDDNLLGADTHDGLRLVERMQTHPELKNIPVVMLTGNARPGDVLKGLVTGVADYVVKPFHREELIAKVTRRLQRLAVTVVVADEDEFLRDVLGQRLRTEGYRVVPFKEGTQLMEYLQWRHADLVIMDWLLPRVDGMTILRMMQDSARLRRIPVILMSTRRRGADFTDAFAAGAADYFVKPLRLEESMARAHRLLVQKGALA